MGDWMLKMNNKGFAISTVIYGLSIMGVLIVSILMGIMSTTRANNREFSKIVEEELTRFSRTEVNLGPLGSQTQTYTIPPGETGWYRIELWGAQGGGANGGLGAYASGIIYLEAGNELYIYVGKHVNGSMSGEETDVRITSGQYTNYASYKTRIMVAAGGGTGSGAHGGTLYGYTSKMTSTGGRIKTTYSQNNVEDYKLETGSNLIGSQTNYEKSSVTAGIEAKPHQDGSRGGDGYFPSSDPNTGGASFIAGYAGTNGLSNSPAVTINSKKYYFYDGRMIAGVNTGNGKARITRIAKKTDETPTLPRKNTKLDNVKAIRDCISTSDTNRKWDSIHAIVDGENKASSMTTDYSKTGYECRKVTLTPAAKIDEIAVFHNRDKACDYINHTIEVSHDGSGWEFVKGPANEYGETSLSETETVTGTRISAYQPDYTKELPDNGNYYVVPVLTENKALSAKKEERDDNEKLKVEYLTGEKRQIWSIELIVDAKIKKAGAGVREYKVIELARFKALSIHMDENKLGNAVFAPKAFNNIARNEISIWKFVPVGNGTYKIQTIMEMFDTGNPSGNLCPNTSATNSDKDLVIIAPNKLPNDTERFKLIALD